MKSTKRKSERTIERQGDRAIQQEKTGSLTADLEEKKLFLLGIVMLSSSGPCKVTSSLKVVRSRGREGSCPGRDTATRERG